ncbi:MAG: DNA polymerase I [Alkalibacterium gilvum]|uniref:DNA polymerase I n=1 Tax=Alkalibacterium TaxID=99906 RepID=UPI000EDB046E|nr:DNA polymerase I [Alkalibacterium sp.]MDN6193820.1 DNA polymerase I [Alkalibacterium sp.]MDN6293627.1 DNA polymerase I [Alkalibacterium sp.]MDN6294925.1 DNA polymerase I [Alkalibacterium sp.]MDN6397491.1 DNA polymerase I [Alkalibacterium sp.]MDN6728686.1 DNA polymerase I [Alkalibacterium sp.]
MTDNKKLLLIDGHSVAFRAFYGLHSQLERMKNKNGLHTNALYGFHNMLEVIVEKEKPTHALVAFDAGKTTFRHEYFKEYKGGRSKMPSEFAEQIPYMKDLLKGFGLKSYELPNFEADDIIGTLSKEAEERGFEVVVLTGDRDLTQLASDYVRIDITKKGVKDLKEYTKASIQEEMGLTPNQIVDMKGLAGDASDNIPGVTKIGEKTALKLLHKYGSIENLYEHIDEMKKSKRKEYLIDEKETAFLSKKLATIDREAPIKIMLDELGYNGQDMEALISFYKEMDFNSHLSKLDTSEYMEELAEEVVEIDFTLVKNIDASMFKEGMALYTEMLDENYHHSEIISIAWGNEENLYVTDPKTAFQSDAFKEWIEDESVHKVVYDAKQTYVALNRNNIKIKGITFDIMLASYLLTAEDSSSGDLADVALKHDYQNISPDEMVYGKGKKISKPEDEALMHDHIARKVLAISVLSEKLDNELKENEQEDLLKKMELPLAMVLSEMEIQGITVDAERLETMKSEFQETLDRVEKQIFKEAGEEFNINSPKQLSVILFEKMGYPVIKKTKTGYSTAQDVLEKLRDQAPIVEYILEYRQISKIQSTYIEGLLKVIDPETSKIHTRYLQTVARTGRLSSVDPNLQNIPIRLEEGRKIRQAFVPREKGWKIYASDYSQIELRILAHISEDEHFIKAFNDDEDIHNTTAMRVFDVDDASKITPNMRRDAKAVNFGIVYGISDYGLSQNLNITRKEAKEYIDTYFERFPGVKKFIDDIIREAKDKGYVETLFHRRRYLPEINSKNFNLRSFAERTAMNTPIQGSAADILKMAMIEMNKRIKENNMQATMLLQVHDEVIFEVPEHEIEQLEKLVEEVMENTVKLSVPLKVDSSYGNSWYNAK